jgi:hypothetical protein
MSKASNPLVAAAKVEGVTVHDAQGEKLGVIKDIYIDKLSGQARFVSVAVGGVLGMGARQYPLPWSALDYDPDQNSFRAGVHPDELTAGPSYEPDQFAADIAWTLEVSDYYAALPPLLPSGQPRPSPRAGRHFTHGTSAATADMAVGGVRPEDKSTHAPHARPTERPAEGEKVDHLAGKVEQAESRQEALLDEGVEESFPASDPVSVKHIT